MTMWWGFPQTDGIKGLYLEQGKRKDERGHKIGPETKSHFGVILCTFLLGVNTWV